MSFINFKNLKKDFQDPDDKAYGKKGVPAVNKFVQKIGGMKNNKSQVMDALANKSGQKKAEVNNWSYQTNPLLMSEDKTINFKKQKNALRQYGDRGYKPSNGIGVGH